METNAFPRSQTPRREFLTTTTKAVATTTLLSGLTHSINSSPVHAAGSDSINIALIGCGGRGGGAAADALGIVCIIWASDTGISEEKIEPSRGRSLVGRVEVRCFPMEALSVLT